MFDYVKKYFDGSLWYSIVLGGAVAVVLGLGVLFFAPNSMGWVLSLLMISGLLVVGFEIYNPVLAGVRPLGSLALCVGAATAGLGVLGIVPALFTLILIGVCVMVYFPSLVDQIKSFFQK